MKEIILNIFKKRTYLSAFIITVLLLFLIVISKNTIFIPLFKKNLIENTLDEVTKISNHISRTINFNNLKSENIDANLQMILEEFKINKLHYFSKNGHILYSTKKNNIGTYITQDYFLEIISKGNIHSNLKYIIPKDSSEIPLTLLEIYIPIMDDGIFTGAFEFYYDITDKISSFDNNVEKLNSYIVIFNFAFFLLIFSLLYFISKNNLKDVKYKADLENFKDIIDETNAYIFTKDTKGCYTFANKLVLELFNIPLEELVGKDDSSFFDLEISNELKKNDELVMKNGQSIEKEELNIVKETGDANTYWSVKRPLYNKDGKIVGMAGISTDITDRKRLEKEIQEQKDLLHIILDNVDAYIYIKDVNRTFRYVNVTTAELFGKPTEEIIGYKDTDVLPKEMADIFWESDRAVFSKNKKVSTEEEIIDPKGKVKHYWSTKVPYELNEENFLIGFSSDITEIHNLKETLKKDAITDALTSLYNRRHFNSIVEKEYKRSIRQNIKMSIIMFDIDHFKKINDTYGHSVGDMILVESSKVYQSKIREEDSVFRIGGEEFTIVLPHTNTSEAVALSERIRVSIENKVFETEQKDKVSITISFGVSGLVDTDEKFEDILLRADTALYEAKKSGRNKVIAC